MNQHSTNSSTTKLKRRLQAEADRSEKERLAEALTKIERDREKLEKANET